MKIIEPINRHGVRRFIIFSDMTPGESLGIFFGTKPYTRTSPLILLLHNDILETLEPPVHTLVPWSRDSALSRDDAIVSSFTASALSFA